MFANIWWRTSSQPGNSGFPGLEISNILFLIKGSIIIAWNLWSFGQCKVKTSIHVIILCHKSSFATTLQSCETLGKHFNHKERKKSNWLHIYTNSSEATIWAQICKDLVFILQNTKDFRSVLLCFVFFLHVRLLCIFIRHFNILSTSGIK